MKTLVSAIATIIALTVPVQAQVPEYKPDTRAPSESEILAVFVTMSTCAWSNKAGFDTTVKRMKLRLEQQARAHNQRLVVTAVALDWDPRVGLNYVLDRFGPFDDVSAGRNWFNALAIDYIWRLADPRPETPQVILFARNVGKRLVGPSFTADSLMTRIIGHDPIVAWVSAGAPLGQTTSRKE